MSSIVERQRLMREKWKQQTTDCQQNNNNNITRTKSSNDVLAAIEQEINEAQERERRHKKSIENRSTNSPIIQTCISPIPSNGIPTAIIVEPPVNYRDPASPSDSVFTSPSSTGEFASTIGSENRQSNDCGDDSAFGSLVDPEDTFDATSVDEDAFAHENLPINAKRSFWERKHKEALESERKRREEELHLESLRQRKGSSRWGDQVKRSSSLTCLIASDFTDGNLPTCEFVEADREKSVQNLPRITVDNMKSHWNGRLSRNISTSHLNHFEDNNILVEQKFKTDLEQSKQEPQDWSKKFSRDPIEDSNRSRKVHKETNNYGSEYEFDLRRSQSHSILDSNFFRGAEFCKRKPKMLHEKLAKGENVVVAIDKSEREKLLKSSGKHEKFLTTARDKNIDSTNGSSAAINISSSKPKLYSKRSTNTSKSASHSRYSIKGHHQQHQQLEQDEKQSEQNKNVNNDLEKTHQDCKPDQEAVRAIVCHKKDKQHRENRKKSKSRRRDQSDADPTAEIDDVASTESLKRRTTSSICSDKRKDLDRNWEQICRKSEPKIEF